MKLIDFIKIFFDAASVARIIKLDLSETFSNLENLETLYNNVQEGSIWRDKI